MSPWDQGLKELRASYYTQATLDHLEAFIALKSHRRFLSQWSESSRRDPGRISLSWECLGHDSPQDTNLKFNES